ncbi:MAG: hypothetical protein KC477_04975 [Oceanospirillaceae bacterium]|nr:hypothetical protein [Oceanospirillaceae bacterium]
MFRKALINILLNNPMSIKELALLLDEHPKDIEDGLQHLQQSLRNLPYQMLIEPACCNKCDFLFQSNKLHKPGRCPQCHGTWISEPLISIEEDEANESRA